MRKLLIFLCLVLLSPPAWGQEQSPSVAVLPFVIHSQQDQQAKQKAITELLLKQLGAEGVKTVEPQALDRLLKPGEAVGTEEQARALGHRLEAVYVVMGSFNQVGNSISLDGRLVDVSGQKKTQVVYAEENGMENLAAATNTLVQQMSVQLLSKAVIAEIKIQGNERIESDAIKATIKSKVGEILKPDTVSEDIKSIYKMGYFESVDANVSDSPAGKILTFVVQENPSVAEVKITGNKKIKEKDILAAISTHTYTVLQRNTVNEDVQKIVKLYHQKGYFNVEIEPKIEFPKEARKAVVTFAIKENKKLYIKKIKFEGNKHFSDRKLRGVMQTKEKFWPISLVTDRGILQRDILDTDVDRVMVFYHDRGFMDAKVGTPDIQRKEDGFVITIPVEEGERYKVDSVQVAGDLFTNNDQIMKKLQLKPKDYFSREKLRKDIEYLSKTYMDEGYAYTEVNPDVKRHPESKTADITYNIKRDGVVHIGKITITGNTKTRDKVIRRALKLSEGDQFSSTAMEKSLTNLRKLDFFEDVQIVPSQGDEHDIMNLLVKVKEKLTGSISVGGGFSSDDGLFASGEVVQRNLFGRGEYLGLKAYFGAETQRYMLSFTEPYLLDTQLSGGFDIYNWLREYNDFTKDSSGFRLRTAYPFGNYSRLTAIYNFEVADIKDVRQDASIFIRSQEGQNIKSSVSIGAERDTTDHPFMPTRGTINAATLEYSTPFLGSDSDFLKYEYHTGVYFPLFWKLVGFTRGEIGVIKELDENNPVPIYERFFLGGINSLRGFDWGDVGPKDEKGEVIGGLKYALINVELLFPLVEKIGMRGVLFFDAGNSFMGYDDIDPSAFRTDAGLGIRWNSPLGPLRVEWGYNLDPQPGEDKYKWQFSAGAFF